MKNRTLILLVCASLSTCAVELNAQALFFDDFETGLSAWTATGTSPLDASTAQNLIPVGGTQSALLNSSADKMYHNLGMEVSGATRATFHIYDSTASRAYGEVRGYTGAGYNNGSLENLVAAGKYNSVTMAGEVFNSAKYQARLSATGFGWFNLDAPGSPDRSTGWHRFDIERAGSDFNFYVDGLLSRTISGAPDFAWDSILIGSVAAGTTAGDAWFDGVAVTPVPEPSTCALIAGLGLTAFAAYRRQTRKA